MKAGQREDQSTEVRKATAKTYDLQTPGWPTLEFMSAFLVAL